MIPFIILICLFSHQNISQYIKTKNEKLSKIYIDQMLIPSDKDCNAILLENKLATLYKLNPNICKKLLDKGLKIKFVKDKTSPEFINKTVDNITFAGYYNTAKKTIYYRLDCSGTYLPELQFHELGHAIDFLLLDCVSNTAEFYNIFSEEATNLFGDTYYNSSNVQYFAQAFTYYYLRKESGFEIRNTAPKTYKYMDKLVKNLKLND